jgi:hypothetical protein
MGEIVKIAALRAMRETRSAREQVRKPQGLHPIMEEYRWVSADQFELQALSDATIARSDIEVVREVGFYLGRGGRRIEILDYVRGKNPEEQDEAISGYATAIAFRNSANNMVGRMDKARRARIKMNIIANLRRALMEPVVNST